MSRQEVLQVPTDTALAHTDASSDPTKGGDSVDIERLDATVASAAAYLFPKERGLLLLTLLFCSAEIQRLDGDGSGPKDVAVTRLQSIEIFARQHQGWSKDTALRYLTVLEALQILERHRKAEYTELHIPLGPWFPNAAVLSAALDGLLEEDVSTRKLQQLAGGVKERFLLLYGPPHSDVGDSSKNG